MSNISTMSPEARKEFFKKTEKRHETETKWTKEKVTEFIEDMIYLPIKQAFANRVSCSLNKINPINICYNETDKETIRRIHQLIDWCAEKSKDFNVRITASIDRYIYYHGIGSCEFKNIKILTLQCTELSYNNKFPEIKKIIVLKSKEIILPPLPKDIPTADDISEESETYRGYTAQGLRG